MAMYLGTIGRWMNIPLLNLVMSMLNLEITWLGIMNLLFAKALRLNLYNYFKILGIC